VKEKGLAPGAVCAAMNVLCYRTCFGPQADILSSDMSKNAPVVIDWYRSPLPTALFKKLHERSDAKAWFQTGGYLLIMLSMALLMLWSWRHWPWWSTAGFFFLYGMVASFLPNGIHELGHGTVFRTKSLNKVFLRVLAFLGQHQFIFFDASHQRHHRYTLHPPDDMEVVLPVKLMWRHFWKQGFLNLAAVRWVIGQHIRMARGKFEGEWELACLPAEEAELRAEITNWSRTVLIGHGLIALVSILTGWWPVTLLFVVGPWTGNWLFWLCNNAQHTGLSDEVSDFRLCCRTIYLNPFLSFLYWRMNFHTEHHMYAAVPCYNLPRLHAAIVTDMPPCPKGLFATWRQINGILRKQRTDPEYQYAAPLPAPNRPAV
jgi:fatty acid desaturase